VPYVEAFITLKVSDIEKAFRIVRENELDAEISTGSNNVHLNLRRYPLDEVINVLEQFKPICVSIED